MKYEEVELEYDYKSLEPYIDSKTVEIHHDKHQRAYLDKLNKAMEGIEDIELPNCVCKLISDLSALPEDKRQAIRNNGGGVFNHIFYWNCLSGKKSEPSNELKLAIERDFSSFENFKNEFNEKSINFFGSGWIWLCKDKDEKLSIVATKNQDSPIMKDYFEDLKPLLCIDLWEHAYYLKYQNRRVEYIEAFWNIVNWEFVSHKFSKNCDCSKK